MLENTKQSDMSNSLYLNLSVPELLEHAILNHEGILATNGALVVDTGEFSGRSPQDKYIVETDLTRDLIWWGSVNHPLQENQFDRLHKKMQDYLSSKPSYGVQLAACADRDYQIQIHLVSERAWHCLFGCQLLIQEPAQGWNLNNGIEDREFGGFTILAAPGCKANPAEDGTRSETFIVLNLDKRIVLIGGTEYAGEIKKCVFTILNFLLPQKDVFPMHCSCNSGINGDSALFFGLSGTGKTTLSADPNRLLLGDDEHGWSETGVFNIEGGCYAKCIGLSREKEPQIWDAIGFASVLENVTCNPATRILDYNDRSHTENTRAAYSIKSLTNVNLSGIAEQPKHIVFLTADAFGVLPAASLLSKEQTMYHFLSGYTAKVSGTERGLSSSPEATFSACFAQPFLPLRPETYADMLSAKIEKHNVKVWLINTGWQGGPPGVGSRIPLEVTRAILNAVLNGELNSVQRVTDPVFQLSYPVEIPGVPQQIVNPVEHWSNPGEYHEQATRLASLFVENFKRFSSQKYANLAAFGPVFAAHKL